MHTSTRGLELRQFALNLNATSDSECCARSDHASTARLDQQYTDSHSDLRNMGQRRSVWDGWTWQLRTTATILPSSRSAERPLPPACSWRLSNTDSESQTLIEKVNSGILYYRGQLPLSTVAVAGSAELNKSSAHTATLESVPAACFNGYAYGQLRYL